MKKLVILGLALLYLGSALFADDSKVMPMMVGRVYAVPTFSFANGEYNSSGKLQKYDSAVKLFNLGFALEYGVINWITFAAQWTPGWTPWSDVSGATSATTLLQNFNSTSDVNTNGVADLFVGAKIQIVGEKAPVKTTMFRFAVAPGVIIPFSGPNFEDEVNNVKNSDTATISKMDNHVFGAGGRFYFDYIINQHFFINLYNETIIYPVKQKLNKDGPNLSAAKGLIPQGVYKGVYDGVMAQTGGDVGTSTTYATNAMNAAKADLQNASGDVNYQYRLTFEIEPQYSFNLNKGIIFSAGLPFNYRYMPAYSYSISGVGTALKTNFASFDLDSEELLNAQLVNKAQHALSINPNIDFFFTSMALPLEFKLQYYIPAWGQNTMARNNLALQIKAYFALPGRPQ